MTTYNEVYSAALAWYYPRVQSLADEAIRAYKEERPEDVEPREFIDEWLIDACDCDLTIYEGPAAAVLLASRNEGAFFNTFGEHGSKSSRAAWALRADVWEALEAREDEWAT